jgi:hypothetical protein
VYINLLSHFTNLNFATANNDLWQIPAATTYGQVAVLLDMTRLGTPTSATLVVVYTDTASVGMINRVGLSLAATPQAPGTTIVPVPSSIVQMSNSATYPQIIEQELDVADLGVTKQWLQIALNIDNNAQRPSIKSAALILYY